MCRTTGRVSMMFLVMGAAALLRVAPVQAARADIGINLGMPWYDYDPLKIFADAVKQARGFIGFRPDNPWWNDDTVAVDADGWPLADAGLVIYHGAARMSGTYRLYFTTQNPSVDARTVEVQYLWATSASGTNQTYDAATNTVHYDVRVVGDELKLNFVNTNGGVKHVKLMRPTALNSTTPYDTSVTFTTPALDLCRRFSTLRFMQVGNALADNMVADWGDRTKPSYSCQQVRSFGGGGSVGVAYEYMVQLCNAVDADIYVCVPFLATDAFVDSLATLLKNTLEPERKIYVEFSNELWNGGSVYDANRNHDSAVAEVNRGGSPLNFDGQTNEWFWAWRRNGRRSMEISRIYRRVFGDAAMMTRVRPLLECQQGNGQASFSEPLHLLLDYYNNPEHVSDPHPPSYYFYGGGGSGYFEFDGSATTLDQIWTSGTMDTAEFIRTRLKTDIDYCATFGLKRVAYESGTEFSAVNRTLCNQAWFDDRITSALIDHHNAWSHYGGGLSCYFTLTGWGFEDLRTSFITSIDSLTTPKLRALDLLLARTPEPVTYGPLVPCTVDGDSFAVEHIPLYDPPSAARAGEWYSYVVRTEHAGTYGVTVDITSPVTGALDILADGASIGKPTLVAGSQTTAKLTVDLGPGLHGFMVRITRMDGHPIHDRLSIDRLTFTVESIIGVTRPAATAGLIARPALRGADGCFAVSTGGAGVYVVSRLDGRVVARGATANGRAVVDARCSGSGVYLLQTANGQARAVLAR